MYLVTPHHEEAESHIIIETDLRGWYSSGGQYLKKIIKINSYKRVMAHVHLLRELHVCHGLQCLVVVPQLSVQTQESNETEVAEVLIEREVSQVSSHGGGFFPSIVGL